MMTLICRKNTLLLFDAHHEHTHQQDEIATGCFPLATRTSLRECGVLTKHTRTNRYLQGIVSLYILSVGSNCERCLGVPKTTLKITYRIRQRAFGLCIVSSVPPTVVLPIKSCNGRELVFGMRLLGTKPARVCSPYPARAPGAGFTAKWYNKYISNVLILLMHPYGHAYDRAGKYNLMGHSGHCLHQYASYLRAPTVACATILRQA